MTENPLRKLLVEEPKREMLAKSLDGLIELYESDHSIRTLPQFSKADERTQIVAYLLGTVASNVLSSNTYESEHICENHNVIGNAIQKQRAFIDYTNFLRQDETGCIYIDNSLKASKWLIDRRQN